MWAGCTGSASTRSASRPCAAVFSRGDPGIEHIYVDDVDAHYAQARASGAVIVTELEDKPYGDRTYAATDLEGHQWHFAQHTRDVSR
ncbi:MAG: VOC family protein [Acidobacteriota bacterium]